jgi:hypothetical protein
MPAPIPIVGIEARSVISLASSAGIPSSTSAKASARSTAAASSNRRSRHPAVWPAHERISIDSPKSPKTASSWRAIQFGTVRFNDKPETRHKCSPGWERFTNRLDVAKLNMRLLLDRLETGTGSSNSLPSGNETLRTDTR